MPLNIENKLNKIKIPDEAVYANALREGKNIFIFPPPTISK